MNIECVVIKKEKIVYYRWSIFGYPLISKSRYHGNKKIGQLILQHLFFHPIFLVLASQSGLPRTLVYGKGRRNNKIIEIEDELVVELCEKVASRKLFVTAGIPPFILPNYMYET
jgi:hypothetical protein